MITLAQAERLVHKIAEILGQPGRESQAAKLAQEYAEAARAAHRRLEQCAVMIEAGEDLQALQLAETPPPVLDLVTVLSFRQASEWRTYCQSHVLPGAEPFFDKHVRLLNAAYGKGLNSDHPYYRDYRQAMMQNDDERALAILRVIARMNAADKHAAQELERLKEKVLRAKLDGLRLVLESGNIDAALARLAEIEAASLAVSTKHPVWQKAQLLRCERLLRQAQALRNQEVWQETEQVLQEIQVLAAQHSVLFPPEDQERFTALEKWAVQCRTAFAEEQDFERALTALDYQVGTAEAKCRPAAGGTLAEHQNDYSALVAKWQDAERFKRPLDEQLLARCQQCSDWFQGRIQSRIRRRRIQSVLATLVVVAALVAAAAFAWDRFRERELLSRFKILESSRRVGDTEKLLAETSGRSTANPRLAVAAQGAQRFVAIERELKQSFDGKFQSLHALGAQEPGVVFAQMESRRSECVAALAALAPEFQTEGQSNLLALDQGWQARLASLQPEREARFAARLGEAERLAAARLNATNDFAIVRGSLAATRGIIDELVRLQAAPFALESGLLGRFRALTNRVALLSQAAAQWEQLQTMLPASLQDYLAWLDRRAQSPFAPAGELAAIEAIRQLRLAPAALLGGLLLPGQPQAWDSLRNQGAIDPPFHPGPALAQEKSAFLNLLNDTNLNDIHFYYFTRNPRPDNPLESHAVLCRGKMSVDRAGKDVGNIYDPKKFPDKMRFEQQVVDTWDYKIEYKGLTRECFALERLGFVDLLDSSTGHYRSSVLELLDRIHQDTNSSAVFRAFAALKLFAIAEQRPLEWGLTWAPGAMKLAQKLKQFGAAEIQSGDWMVPRQLTLNESAFQKLFAETRLLSFKQEARFLHRLAFRAGEAGVAFAGFAGETGHPVLTQTNAVRGEYWGCAARTKAPALLFRRNASDGTSQMVTEPLPFTPLFEFNGDRAQMLESAVKSTLHPWREAGTPLPPLFHGL